MTPIFFNIPILDFACCSFILLKDKFTIRRGISLSRFSIIAVRMYSVKLLYARFRFVVLFRNSSIFGKLASVRAFWDSLSTRIFLAFLTLFRYYQTSSSFMSQFEKSRTYFRSCLRKSSIIVYGTLSICSYTRLVTNFVSVLAIADFSL